MRPGPTRVMWALAAVVALALAGAAEAIAATCSGNPAAVANAAWSCAGTQTGATCTATCRSGYTSQPAPTALCGPGGTWAAPSGGCYAVCRGSPSAELLSHGTWSASCTNSVRINGWCQGTCDTANGYTGAPAIRCTAAGFDAASVVGKCVQGPSCASAPRVAVTSGSFPASCAGTPVNGVCTGTCNQGYGGPVKPQIKCTPSGWETTPTGGCAKACFGAPPAELLAGAGVWPESCAAGDVAVNGRCTASCSDYGTASIACGAGGWIVTTFLGSCSSTPVCPGPLPGVLNGQFPASCVGAPWNTVCRATCNTGYDAVGSPYTKCMSNTSTWSAPDPAMCVRGSIRSGRAIIADGRTPSSGPGASVVIICALSNGVFSDCQASPPWESFESPPGTFNQPLGVAVVGTKVWVSENLEGVLSRVTICNWDYGYQLTDCIWSYMQYSLGPGEQYVYGGGNIAIDAAHNVGYVAADQSFCVVVCADAATMTNCTCMMTPDALPVGLSIGAGSLWITTTKGLQTCPLKAGGVTNIDEECTLKEWGAFPGAVVDNSTNPATLFEGYGVLVDPAGAGTVFLADTQHGLVRACNLELTTCVTTNADGTADAGGPGYIGLGIDSTGLLYTPLTEKPAISVCRNAASVSDCSLSLGNGYEFHYGTSSLVVVAPPKK